MIARRACGKCFSFNFSKIDVFEVTRMKLGRNARWYHLRPKTNEITNEATLSWYSLHQKRLQMKTGIFEHTKCPLGYNLSSIADYCTKIFSNSDLTYQTRFTWQECLFNLDVLLTWPFFVESFHFRPPRCI